MTGAAARVLTVACHYVHLGIMAFIILGWVLPFDMALLAHLVFVPFILGLWYLNDCSCPLNNIESYLLKGLWRDPDNREEGSFIVVLVEHYLGLNPGQKLMDMITYAIMGLAWSLSGLHLWLRMEG